MEKEYITWKQVEDFIDMIYKEFNGKITGVYGIPRGGLVFAVMVSHKLNVPLLLAPIKGCLVVDDILDSGETMLHYKKCGYKIATMHYVTSSCVKGDLAYDTFAKDENNKGKWIVYPWENKN